MAANNTNQSMLSGYTRPQYDNTNNNQRSQAYTRNTSPNTPYNTPGDTNMQSNLFGYSPSGYGGQNPGLGRYVPPMMQGNQGNGFGNPTSWFNNGGYAYNTPQAYTGGYGQQGMFNSAGNQMGGMSGGQPFGGFQPGYGQQGGGFQPNYVGGGGQDAQRAAQAGGSGGQFGGMYGALGGGGQGGANSQFMQFLQQLMSQRQQGVKPQGSFGIDPAGPPADEQITPIPARSNNVNSFGQFLSGNSLGGMGRPGAAPSPVDTWSQGGVQPQPPQRANSFGGYIDPNQGARDRAPRLFAGLPGGFGGG